MQNESSEAEWIDTTEVATRPEAEPQPFEGSTGLLTPAMIAAAEAMVEGVRKIKQIALKVTTHADWIQMGKKGYLADSGGQKVSRLFGITWEKPTIREETAYRADENGTKREVKTYICDIVAVWNGKRYPQQGVVSSEASFYAKKSVWEGDKKIEYEIPFSERDFVKMRKHALTNAMGRALRGILGLNGIPWEEVQAALGGEVASKAAAVKYEKKAATTTQTAGEVESTDIRSKLHSMLMDLTGGDAEKAAAKLEAMTSFQGKDGSTVKGFRDPHNPKIRDSWIMAAYGKVKKEWEPTFGGPPPERQPGED